MKFLSFLFFNIVITCTAFAQEKKDSNCPSLSEDDRSGLCSSILHKLSSSKESQFAYEFEERLWEFVCTEPTDEIMDNPEKLQVVHKKIQAMWLANRNLFFLQWVPYK